MTEPAWRDPLAARALPIERDADPFADVRRSAWPRFRASVLAVVFVGGCAGGLVRYLASLPQIAAASAA